MGGSSEVWRVNGCAPKLRGWVLAIDSERTSISTQTKFDITYKLAVIHTSVSSRLRPRAKVEFCEIIDWTGL